MFSLMRDWSKCVKWLNIAQLKLRNIQGYSPIFIIYCLMETLLKVWENEKCCRRWMFPQLFRILASFYECFYNSIETQRTCSLFLLENTTTKKGKQLVYFGHQNLNSLCFRHHYVNSSCLFCVSVKFFQ